MKPKIKKSYQAAIRIWQKSENGEAGTITKVCGQTSRLTKMDVKMDLYLIYIYPRSLELELMSHQDCLCSIRKINKKTEVIFRRAVAASGFMTAAQSKNTKRKITPKVCGVGSTMAHPFIDCKNTKTPPDSPQSPSFMKTCW